MTMNNPLYDLNNLELAELMLLWQVRSLLKQINEHPSSRYFIHLRLWDDCSGGLFVQDANDYEQVGKDWNNLEQAVAVMSEYLQSLG